MALGQRLRQLRTQHGLSQEEFGELLDTTRQTVSRWELDQVCPEISKIVMISKQLSVTTDSLLRDGITTFEDDCGKFSCGVYRSSVSEVVQTEKFTLIYYKAPDTGTMGVRLYFGYRAKKRLVAVCEHIRAQSRTEYAFSARQNGAVISNSARLSKLLGEGCSDTVTEGMRRTERFDIDREAKEQPRVSEAGIRAVCRSGGASPAMTQPPTDLISVTARVKPSTFSLSLQK